ncbi:hypothetical protein X801_05858 [Opisthorchis viverrini]|uniref:Uncharacterized protein n=1 Tax=Opisthorchis viverrini TaxID=6198 RepID=A0A1S8WUV0_OPIVI|nr:hypothetical protein X801_05858 [Opisthorchis viverrini]
MSVSNFASLTHPQRVSVMPSNCQNRSVTFRAQTPKNASTLVKCWMNLS